LSVEVFPQPLRTPPPRTCPVCSCDLWGARLCEVCGATDFGGEGAWVCFSCGQDNDHADESCDGCGEVKVMACPACGGEGFHRDLTCSDCGAARAFYPRIRRLLHEAARPRAGSLRERAYAAAVLLAAVAVALATTLGAAGQRRAALMVTGAGATCGVAAMWSARPR
jgi:hypothetical protein